MLVKIERSFARFAEDSGAEKHELRSYRTGFVSPVDKRERGILQNECQGHCLVANSSPSNRKGMQKCMEKPKDYVH